MAVEAIVLAGTRKGLSSGIPTEPGKSGVGMHRRSRWKRSVRWRSTTGVRFLVGSTSLPFGPQVYWSDDLGATWSESHEGTVHLPPDEGESIERIWQLQPSRAQDGVVWVGTQPSALFCSDDRGETFELVRSLWDHPHRPEWHAGFGGQAIHTIVPHPTDPDIVTVAMSTGGVYRTEDGGASWHPRNRGITTDFQPGEAPEFGQCVHKVAVDAGDPDEVCIRAAVL